MHSLHNYNQRNPQENQQRNLGGNTSGGKNKDNRTNDYNKSTKSSNEKTHDHSSNLDNKQEQDKNHSNKMPILNEKFASKCTISDSSTANKDQQTNEIRKDDLKDKETQNLQKTSKNNSTESESSNQDTTNSGGRDNIQINKNLNQTKSSNSSNYTSSTSSNIQQSNITNQQTTQSTNLASNVTSSNTATSSSTTANTAATSKLNGTPVLNRIFVGGISTDTTENELQNLFSQFGTIKAVKIIIDREGIPKGYGFITYTTEEEASKVLKESDNLVLKNRKLNVAIAVKKQSSNPSLASSSNLTRSFDLNQYFQNGNMFYMPNGLNSIPATAYMNEYPISFPPDTYAYALPHLNPPFTPYPAQFVYRHPSSLYFPSMHPSATGSTAASQHPTTGNHAYGNHPASVQTGGTVNLQQSNAQDTSQYSNQQTSIQQGTHTNQTQQQANQQSTHHHHSNRLNSNNSNQLNSNQTGSNNQQDASCGYQSQYHHHPLHLNQPTSSGYNQHHNTHQHISAHHSHQQNTHTAQTNLSNTSQSGASNQQHTPVFINTTSMPYIHPLSLQYNPSLASAISANAINPAVPTAYTNTTQPHQTSLTHHQAHYTHNPLSSQHSQPVNQFPMNPNWVHNSQQGWR